MFLSTYYIEMDFTYALKSFYNSFDLNLSIHVDIIIYLLNCYAWKSKYKYYKSNKIGNIPILYILDSERS